MEYRTGIACPHHGNNGEEMITPDQAKKLRTLIRVQIQSSKEFGESLEQLRLAEEATLAFIEKLTEEEPARTRLEEGGL
jgi:hypothetical protein